MCEEKPLYGPCEICGEYGAELRLDPYNEAIGGLTWERNLCDECYDELEREV